jgi:hypothetical protein
MRYQAQTRGACAALFLSLAACGGEDGPGRLHLAVTDAPLDDATAVVVEFEAVEVQPMGGAPARFEMSAPKQVDLLALQGGLAEPLLNDVPLPSGRYQWLRLMVVADGDSTRSRITLEDGSVHALRIPSGAETGLKLVQGFTVPAGGLADFTVDFDLRKSVHRTGGATPEYLLRPTLRLVDNTLVGDIAGSVAAALITPDCAPAVYVYTGNVVPDDIDGAGVEPVTTATVGLDPGTGAWTYRAAFLLPGEYTVAFTCDADADEPDTSDPLVFAPIRTATVSTDLTTTVDFSL